MVLFLLILGVNSLQYPINVVIEQTVPFLCITRFREVTENVVDGVQELSVSTEICQLGCPESLRLSGHQQIRNKRLQSFSRPVIGKTVLPTAQVLICPRYQGT